MAAMVSTNGFVIFPTAEIWSCSTALPPPNLLHTEKEAQTHKKSSDSGAFFPLYSFLLASDDSPSRNVLQRFHPLQRGSLKGR